jgi:hypothetical protein
VSACSASVRAPGVSESLGAHGTLSRSRDAVLLTPSPGELRRSVSTRSGVPSRRRRSTATTRRVALHDLRDADVAPGAQPGMPVCARADWVAPGLAHRSDRGDASLGTDPLRSVCRPAAHLLEKASHHGQVTVRAHRTRHPHRVRTIMARAIHTTPGWVLTRLSSLALVPGRVVARPGTPGRLGTRRQRVLPNWPPSAHLSRTRHQWRAMDSRERGVAPRGSRFQSQSEG